MKLHLNKTLFTQAIRATSDQMKILPIYIEKDYWVTFALYTLFHHEIGKDIVFKGGTALSKCYNLIERFSEDIDLVVLRSGEETNGQLTRKIIKIGEVVNSVLPEVQIEGLTHKMGMNRKTAHSYTKEFQGDYGQIRDAIVVEATWLGYHEPYTMRMLNSLVGDMMVKTGQTKMAEENGMNPFEVRVLEPSRTLCEKIMSLIRFSYGENPVEDLKKKIRHTYDLHQLLQQEEFSIFFESPAFEKMLLKVANDDVISFKNNHDWLKHHPTEAYLFKRLDEVWKELKPVYNGDFKNLVYGELPKEEAVLNSLQRIKGRVKDVHWKIEIKKK